VSYHGCKSPRFFVGVAADAVKRCAANGDVDDGLDRRAGSDRPPASSDTSHGQRGSRRTLARVRENILSDRTSIDRAGEAASSDPAADVLHGPQRAAAHGAAPVQHALSLVRRFEHRRGRVGRYGFHQDCERFLEGEIAARFFESVLGQARANGLLSDEHFTVDGTLIEAWASHKSFKPMDDQQPPAGGGSNPTVDFKGTKRSNDTHRSTTDPDAALP